MRGSNREIWILRIIMLLSALIGWLVAYFFGSSFNKWFFEMDLMDNSYLIFGITASACLFIGGFIKGRMERRKMRRL